LIITLLVLVFNVRELPSDHAAVSPQASPHHAALPRSFYLFLVIIVLFTLGNSSDAFLILRAKSLGVTLLEIPLVIALFNLMYALLAVPLGSLSDKIGRIPTMCIGWGSYALVYLGFALASGAAIIWPLYALYGVYYAANQGVAKAFLSDIVEPGHRGRAFGIYAATVGIATLPASFIAGFLWDRVGAAAPFYFGAAMAIIASALLALFSKKLRSA
jgi:MFS family permease